MQARIKLPVELELSVDSVKGEIGIHFSLSHMGTQYGKHLSNTLCLKCMVLAPLSIIQWL